MSNSLKSLVEEVEFLVAERNDSLARGFVFKIVHRYRIPGTNCVPGEEVLAISLVYRGREYQLRLAPALLLLGDYLLRHRRFAETATHISAGIQAEGFSSKHARKRRGSRMYRMPRSAIRQYIRRLVMAIGVAFEEAHISVDPGTVLLTEESVSNQVLYRWKAASVEVVHVDSTAAGDQPIRGTSSRRGLLPILAGSGR